MIFACDKQSYLITADTTVTVGRRFLIKTSDKSTAEEYLRLLSGRRHSVYTAFCVKHDDFIISKLRKTVLCGLCLQFNFLEQQHDYS